MIHEFKKEYLDLPLEDYILTFDDGLYTQYKFFNEIKKINTEKYFFISSNIVCDEEENQDDNFILCHEAHIKALKNKDYSNYMKWSQIREIQRDKNCHVGCHSHYHDMKTADCIECIINDNQKMVFEFIKNLGYLPHYFCFPYNYKTEKYQEVLKLKGFKHFYGKERIDINELQYSTSKLVS